MISSSKLSRFLLILVAAGWRRDEIHELIRDLSRFSPAELDRLISEISSFRRYISGVTAEYHYDTHEPSMSTRVSDVSGAGRKVQRLLREDVGMTNEDAVRALTKELTRMDSSRAKFIPKYSKKTLVSWVDKLSAIFTPSEILHAATVVRNKYVHDTSLDWKLRKNEP